MVKNALAGISVAVGTLVCAGTAQAALLTFNSLASFNASSGATTLENFSSAAVGFSTSNYSGTFNGFSINSTSNGDFSGIATGTIANGGNNTAIPAAFNGQNFYGWGTSGNGGTAPTSVFTTSFSGVTAFGFDFFNTDQTDSYTILVNGTSVGTIGFAGVSAAASGFFGVIGTGGDTITTVQIQTSSFGGYISTAGVDNVRVSSASVPEPASLALVGLGLAFAGSTLRRKGRGRAG